MQTSLLAALQPLPILAAAPTLEKAGSAVATALGKVLANTAALTALSQLAHWNVEGKEFVSLHSLFNDHYDELFAAQDAIAEQIRKLGSYAPGGIGALSKLSDVKEFEAPLTSSDMLVKLVQGHTVTMDSAAAARDAAGTKDLETQNLMIDRVDAHKKALWMLNSLLK